MQFHVYNTGHWQHCAPVFHAFPSAAYSHSDSGDGNISDKS